MSARQSRSAQQAMGTVPGTGTPPPEGVAASFPAGTTPEEIAAVLALLAAGAGNGEEPGGPAAPSQWGHPRRAVRRRTTPGPSGWWTSQLP